MTTKNKIIKSGSLVKYSSAKYLRDSFKAGGGRGNYRAQRSDAGKKRK
jgi:hypothetical protein